MTKLTLTDGSVVGLTLGHAISEGGMMLEGQHKMPVAARADAPADLAEAYVSKLAGRYIAILNFDGNTAVYPDPTCSLGPVFHPQGQMLASSAALVLDRPLHDQPAPYAFGRTADAQVFRCLGNHRIDLADFAMRRFWPHPDTNFALGARSHHDVSDEIADKLRSNVAALSGRFDVAMPITGETGSRLMLAAAAPVLDQVRQFFAYHTSANDPHSADIAHDIAQNMCLPLQVMSYTSPRYQSAFTEGAFATHLAKRRLRGGFEADDTQPGNLRAHHLLAGAPMILHSDITGIATADHWARAVFHEPDNVEHAMHLLGITSDDAAYADMVEDFKTWASLLPECAAPCLFDFFLTEVLLPHGASAAAIRNAQSPMVDPFNDRRLIQLAITVPPKVRKNRRVLNHILHSHAPEILRVPYHGDRIQAVRKTA